MKLSMSLACDESNCIGRNGELPWYEPYDMQRFQRITWGKAVIMGRKTWESLPTVLPGRKVIVMSSKTGQGNGHVLSNLATAHAPDAVVSSKAEAVHAAKHMYVREAVVIGGQQIFELFFNDVNLIYYTLIHKKTIAGDTFFDITNFGKDFIQEKLPPVDEGHTDSTFYVLERKTQLVPEE